MSEPKGATRWSLNGVGYEFCNCNPGCTCNFAGFPSSADGSCRAFIVNVIAEGHCGDTDLSGITCAVALDWPKAIHDGNGRIVLIFPASITDDQVDALVRIYSGSHHGIPWGVLGTTYVIAGVIRADFEVTPRGIESSIRLPGIGNAVGTTLRNPVTGEPHQVAISLNEGFIWKYGECGVGSFKVDAGDIHLDYEGTSWILYDFDWGN